MIDRKIIWITEGGIEFLESYLTKDMHCLEFGAGASTKWLADRVSHLISIEHDSEWIKKVSESLPGNVTLHQHNRDYSVYVSIFPDEHFDFILVDGRDRVNCVKEALPKLKKGGYLMLDNSEREEYKESIDLMEGYESYTQIKPDSEGFVYPDWQTLWWKKQ